MIRRHERDGRGWVDLCAGFRLELPVDAHLTGENERPRALARRREALVEHKLIQPNTQNLQP
jgi:hypothetical protein